MLGRLALDPSLRLNVPKAKPQRAVEFVMIDAFVTEQLKVMGIDAPLDEVAAILAAPICLVARQHPKDARIRTIRDWVDDTLNRGSINTIAGGGDDWVGQFVCHTADMQTWTPLGRALPTRAYAGSETAEERSLRTKRDLDFLSQHEHLPWLHRANVRRLHEPETVGRAMEFFRSHLTPEERLQWLSERSLVVEGGETHTRYRVHQSGRVESLGKDGKVSASFCVHFQQGEEGAPPTGDLLLALKLLIETSEAEFLAIANRSVMSESEDSDGRFAARIREFLADPGMDSQIAWRQALIALAPMFRDMLKKSRAVREALNGPIQIGDDFCIDPMRPEREVLVA